MDGYFSEGGVFLIAGKSSVGKTTLMNNLLRAWRHGSPFLNAGTTPSSVVYLSEETRKTVKGRYKGMGLADDQMAHVDYWWHHKAVKEGLDWRAILQRARTRAQTIGAKVIVVDTFLKWASSVIKDPNEPMQIIEAFETLHQLADEGFVVLLLLQGRKSGGVHGDGIAYSTQIMAEADGVWVYDYLDAKYANRHKRTLQCEKNRDNPAMKDEKVLLLIDESQTLSVQDTGHDTHEGRDDARKEETKNTNDRVLDYVKRVGDAGATAREIEIASKEEGWNISKSTAENSLEYWEGCGTVTVKEATCRGGRCKRYFDATPNVMFRRGT